MPINSKIKKVGSRKAKGGGYLWVGFVLEVTRVTGSHKGLVTSLSCSFI